MKAKHLQLFGNYRLGSHWTGQQSSLFLSKNINVVGGQITNCDYFLWLALKEKNTRTVLVKKSTDCYQKRTLRTIVETDTQYCGTGAFFNLDPGQFFSES